MDANNNNNSSAFNLENFLKLAECSICCELKSDHRTLPACGHSFCLEDLEELSKKDKNSHQCPLCRKQFVISSEGVKALNKDFHKVELVELARKYQSAMESNSENGCWECGNPASLWCEDEDCGYCGVHAEEAHKCGKAKNHSLVHPSNKVLKFYCSEHKKELEKYCRQCEKVICMGHKIDKVETVAREKKAILLGEWIEIEEKEIETLNDVLEQLTEEGVRLDENIATVTQTANSYFESLQQTVEQKRREVLAQIQQKSTQQSQISAQIIQVKQKLTEIQMQGKVISTMLEKLPPVRWMEKEPVLRQQLSRIPYHRQPLQIQLIQFHSPGKVRTSVRSIGAIISQVRKIDNQHIRFDFVSNFDTEGLLYWLGTLNSDEWTNPQTNEEIEISTSHPMQDGNNAAIVCRVGGAVNCWGGPGPQFFQVDLKERRFKCNRFTLRLGADLKNWIFSASNNMKDWVTLHSASATFVFQSPVKSFSVPEGKHFYRYFRVLQKGEEEQLLEINGFEMYGELELTENL